MNRTSSRRNFTRPGLTLVELCIGMAITGMIAAATASFVLATAGVWKESTADQALRLTAAQTCERFGPGLRAALRVDRVFSAADGEQPGVSFWAIDGSPGTVDRLPEAGEMRLIQYNPQTGVLWLYMARPASELSVSQLAAANTALTTAELTDRVALERIKTASWARAYALFGATSASSTDDDRPRLTGATFTLVPAADGSRQRVDVALNLQRGSTEVSYSARFTPRALVPTE